MFSSVSECVCDSVFYSFDHSTHINRKKYLFSLACICFLFSIIVLYPLHASASDFQIDVSPQGISGYSNNAPLKDILSELSQKTGYRIYLNDKLANKTSSFFIASKIDHEKAIKLIIQPHSNIMVFGLNENHEPDISEIKVYPRSGKSGRYLPLHNNTGNSYSSRSKNTSYNINSHSASSGAASNDNGRTLPDKIKNNLYNVEKSAFGTPVLKRNNLHKGPGRSLNSSDMRKAYAKYKMEKKQYEHRVSSSQKREGYLAAQKQRQEYIYKRQQAYVEQVSARKVKQ